MKTKQKILKRLERIEVNASLLLKEAATLREELSGGSDSSNSKSSLSMAHKEALIKRRHKVRLKQG